MNATLDLCWLALGVVASCEMVLRSPIAHHSSRLNQSIRLAMLRLFLTRVSDHRKAFLARRYAVNVLVSTGFVFILIFTAVVPFFAAMWLVSGSLDGIAVLVSRLDVAIVSMIVAVGYTLFRTGARARG